MEAVVNAAEVLGAPQPGVDEACPEEGSPVQADCVPAVQALLEPMDDLSRKLEDILKTYGSADAAATDNTQSVEPEKMEEETGSDVTKETAKEDSLVIQSLNKMSSQDEKLNTLIQKYSELADVRRSDDRKVCALQQQVSRLQRERDLLRSEHHRGVLARSQLEGLCRELQRHNKTLKEETLRRCREDEEKRREVSSHFQSTLNDIQAQIEQYSGRNNKLSQENRNLADKLDGLMHQYEQREESLEKVNHHRDLQHKLAEAKLEQANALLTEAEDKHRREKEYLLREAIDKTKKCCTMKEQELAMKKKLLVQAAHWKLQTQEVKEQGTVMQSQLTLYSQKFDEFQATLSKSNDIYVSFKQEMDKMNKKMKKLEKESDVWKERFESCNKALADMVTERVEKGKEFEMFVLKISKLETLCRALQEERKVLYDKIKEVRSASSSLPALLHGDTTTATATSTQGEGEDAKGAEPGVVPSLTEPELQELQSIQESDPVLTEDMARLRAEQARLQEFAASLFSPSAATGDTSSDEEEEEEEEEEPKKEEPTIASSIKPTVQEKKEKVEVEEEPKKEEPTIASSVKPTVQEKKEEEKVEVEEEPKKEEPTIASSVKPAIQEKKEEEKVEVEEEPKKEEPTIASSVKTAVQEEKVEVEEEPKKEEPTIASSVKTAVQEKKEDEKVEVEEELKKEEPTIASSVQTAVQEKKEEEKVEVEVEPIQKEPSGNAAQPADQSDAAVVAVVSEPDKMAAAPVPPTEPTRPEPEPAAEQAAEPAAEPATEPAVAAPTGEAVSKPLATPETPATADTSEEATPPESQAAPPEAEAEAEAEAAATPQQPISNDSAASSKKQLPKKKKKNAKKAS